MTPNVDMMSGLCLVGIFQFGDTCGYAELDAPSGIKRISPHSIRLTWSCRHGCGKSSNTRLC